LDQRFRGHSGATARRSSFLTRVYEKESPATCESHCEARALAGDAIPDTARHFLCVTYIMAVSRLHAPCAPSAEKKNPWIPGF
jgi:hypothetical protein